MVNSGIDWCDELRGHHSSAIAFKAAEFMPAAFIEGTPTESGAGHAVILPVFAMRCLTTANDSHRWAKLGMCWIVLVVGLILRGLLVFSMAQLKQQTKYNQTQDRSN
jgi:hypothetical protein